jgi:exonuclease VII small subunit
VTTTSIADGKTKENTMSIAKLLERHQASLEEVLKAFERPRVADKDLQFGEALKKRRIAEVSARIASLDAERQAVVERIDQAIAAEKETLALLERAFAIPDRAGKTVGRGRPKEPQSKAPPSRATPAEPTAGQRTAGKPAEGKSTAAQPKTTHRRPKT